MSPNLATDHDSPCVGKLMDWLDRQGYHHVSTDGLDVTTTLDVETGQFLAWDEIPPPDWGGGHVPTPRRPRL